MSASSPFMNCSKFVIFYSSQKEKIIPFRVSIYLHQIPDYTGGITLVPEYEVVPEFRCGLIKKREPSILARTTFCYHLCCCVMRLIMYLFFVLLVFLFVLVLSVQSFSFCCIDIQLSVCTLYKSLTL